MFEHIGTTDKMPAACELLSSILADQNHKQKWLNMHYVQFVSCSSVFELITITEKMTEHETASEWLSGVWTNWNLWQEWLNPFPGCELLSGIWENQNHWQEWLNIMIPTASELLSSVWAYHDHWQECLNMLSEREPLFNFFFLFPNEKIDINGWTFLAGELYSSIWVN